MEKIFDNLAYDYVEYYVNDAEVVADWHVTKMGFEKLACTHPGAGDRRSILLKKNTIRLLFTAAAAGCVNEVSSFVEAHGEGVKRIAVYVEKVQDAFSHAVNNGGIPVKPPRVLSDRYGSVEHAAVRLLQDNELVFINRRSYDGLFMPGYSAVADAGGAAPDSGLSRIDHVAYALGEHETTYWERYLHSILDSSTVQEINDDGENKLGMSLKVLQSRNRNLTNVFSEPVNNSPRKSQIQIFVDEFRGSGVQHLAFESGDIFKTVELLKENGIQFTPIPRSYYKLLKEKYPQLEVDRLERAGVLCDVIDGALLLQIFTTPIGERPTLFYEFVQRVNNYAGFGIESIKTLFQAVQRNLSEYEAVDQVIE